MAGSAVLILVVLLLVVGIGAAFLLLNSGTSTSTSPKGERAVVLGTVGATEGFDSVQAAKDIAALDPTAKIIWSSRNASLPTRPTGTQAFTFQRYYDNNKDSSIDATLYVFIDESGNWEFNTDGGKLTEYPNKTVAPVTVKPGRNILTLNTINKLGAGGLAYTVIDGNGKILFHSDSETYKTE